MKKTHLILLLFTTAIVSSIIYAFSGWGAVKAIEWIAAGTLVVVAIMSVIVGIILNRNSPDLWIFVAGIVAFVAILVYMFLNLGI